MNSNNSITISAVVVAYNIQSTELLTSIKSYINDVESVIVCDNSTDKKLDTFFNSNHIDKVVYMNMGGNVGIAKALNVGIRYLIQHGSDWILTMDQDSHFSTSLDGFKKLLHSFQRTDLVLTPCYHYTDENAKNEKEVLAYKQITKCVQSGNLFHRSCFEKCGYYEEHYFIDYVDYDFCMRLKSEGYQILRVNNVILNHHRGNLREVHLLGFIYKFAESNPIRVYYQTRNFLDYFKKYHDFPELNSRLKIFLRMFILESKKGSKFFFLIKGVKDYLNNRWGKLKE